MGIIFVIHVFKAVGGRIGLKSETQNLQVCGWEVACHGATLCVRGRFLAERGPGPSGYADRSW